MRNYVVSRRIKRARRVINAAKTCQFGKARVHRVNRHREAEWCRELTIVGNFDEDAIDDVASEGYDPVLFTERDVI